MSMSKFETMLDEATLITCELLKKFNHFEALMVLEMAKESIKDDV